MGDLFEMTRQGIGSAKDDENSVEAPAASPHAERPASWGASALPPPPPPPAFAESANSRLPDEGGMTPGAVSEGGGGGVDADSADTALMTAQPPTPEEHRRNYFFKITLCHLYGIFLITFGTLLTVCDAYYIQSSVTPGYCIVLCSVGAAYLIYLMVDIWLVERKEKVTFKHHPSSEDFDAQLQPETVPYSYDLSPHGSNFYLKMGAAAFALGHLVHHLLIFIVQYSAGSAARCSHWSQLVMDVVEPAFSFLLLVFVFKYNNLIIHKRKMLARFGCMHVIGLGVTLWVSAIVRETMLALAAYSASINRTNAMTVTVTDQTAANYAMTWDFETYSYCLHLTPTVREMFENYSPYLFPFTVEFNIIMVCFFLTIWLNIGRQQSNEPHAATAYPLGSVHSLELVEDTRSRSVVAADCGGSGRGAAVGFLLLVITIGHLVVCFILANSDQKSFKTFGRAVSDGTRLLLHAALLAGVLGALLRTRALHAAPAMRAHADTALLLLCTPGVVVEAAMTFAATLVALNYVKCLDACVGLVQCVLQSAFIADRLRRCSESASLRRLRPGRQFVTLLLTANVCVWLLNTFAYKSPAATDERYTFYGKVTWTVVGHVCLPLIMFYRFHSSACLADIWQLAYQSSAH